MKMKTSNKNIVSPVNELDDDVEAQVGRRHSQQPAVFAQWSWIQWAAIASLGVIAFSALGIGVAALAMKEPRGVIINQQKVRVLKSGGFSYAFEALESAFEESYPWIKMEIENGR